MMLKSLDNQKVFLSGDDHLQLALFLSDQAKSIKWLKSWLPPDYDHKNIYALLTRLKQRQFISQAAKGQFQLSAIGQDRLFRLYPLLAVRPRRKSDMQAGRPIDSGYFFTAILDFGGYGNIFSKKKLELMKFLHLWGWGRLTRGIYLSGSQLAANSLNQHLASYRLTELVTQGVLAINENQKRLADRIFNLTSRNADWRLIIDRLNEWQRIDPPGGEASEPRKGLRLIRKDFLILLVTEPLLPTDLLPENYWMEEAVGIIIQGK